jgi:hypothetical protein
MKKQRSVNKGHLQQLLATGWDGRAQKKERQGRQGHFPERTTELYSGIYLNILCQ